LPSQEDFNKSLGYMQQFFRTFKDIVKDMDKEDGDGGTKLNQKT
jgi:hypothetical protein